VRLSVPHGYFSLPGSLVSPTRTAANTYLNLYSWLTHCPSPSEANQYINHISSLRFILPRGYGTLVLLLPEPNPDPSPPPALPVANMKLLDFSQSNPITLPRTWPLPIHTLPLSLSLMPPTYHLTALSFPPDLWCGLCPHNHGYHARTSRAFAKWGTAILDSGPRPEGTQTN